MGRRLLVMAPMLAALAGFLVGALGGGVLAGRLGRDRGLLQRAGAAAELVLVAGALALTAALRARRPATASPRCSPWPWEFRTRWPVAWPFRISPPPCSP